MDRSVAAVGATSGTLSALLIRLAADFLSSDQVGLDCPICPEAWAGFGQFEQFDPASVLLGIIVGLCVGPLLDLCYLARPGAPGVCGSEQDWHSCIDKALGSFTKLYE